MAIAVPFLLTAVGATATTVAITTVAFAVTGISAKINQAAVSVFGEDLVKVANIAGAAYGAFNGGFDLGGEAANIGYGELAADGMTDMAAVEAANAAEAGVEAGMSVANATYPGITDTADMDAVQNAIAGDAAPTNVVAKVTNQSAPVANQVSVIEPTFSEAQSYAIKQSPGAAGSGASASQVANTAGAKDITDSWSLADLKKLVTNKDGTISNAALQAGGNIVQGAFGGYSAAKTREQAQVNYDAAIARQARLANLGTGAWKQTQ